MMRPPMNLNEALDCAAKHIDEVSAQLLRQYEARLRQEIAQTGPEDEEALDLPPDPHASWHRVSVEELVMSYQRRLELWRVETLRDLRGSLQDWLNEPKE